MLYSIGKPSDLAAFRIDRNEDGVPLFPGIDIWKMPVDDVARVIQDYITALWGVFQVSSSFRPADSFKQRLLIPLALPTQFHGMTLMHTRICITTSRFTAPPVLNCQIVSS